MATRRSQKNLYVKMNPDQLARWEVAAQADQRTLSSFVRKAVEQYIEALKERGELPPES